jgi:EAL domain-containing protein (putative c-di-GMP-specific phosphodiesterase class I)
VPEGVETETQLAQLVDMGCEFAQGFLLARPLDADGVEALLTGGTPAAG